MPHNPSDTVQLEPEEVKLVVQYMEEGNMSEGGGLWKNESASPSLPL